MTLLIVLVGLWLYWSFAKAVGRHLRRNHPLPRTYPSHSDRPLPGVGSRETQIVGRST
jgi:hypothetical protein